jgi:quercetin dioxygenase-like cupin family protein
MTGSTKGKPEKGLAPAKRERLERMVAYARGSIVSREIVRNRAGTVTLFAFDRGQGLSEHTAPFDALVQLVAGRARLTIGGRRVLASAGDVVLMPAGVPHAVQAMDRFKMLLTMLRGSR